MFLEVLKKHLSCEHVDLARLTCQLCHSPCDPSGEFQEAQQ